MKKTLLSIFLIFTINLITAQSDWAPVSGYFSFQLPMDFAQAQDGTIYMLASNSTYNSSLLKSTDNGNTWSISNPPTYPQDDNPLDIVSTGSKLLIVATSVYVSSDNGQTWTLSNTGLPTDIDYGYMTTMPNGDVFLTGSKTVGQTITPQLFKSINGGGSWSPVTMNGLSPQMEVPTDIINLNGSLIMSLNRSTSGGGGVCVSSDGGQNWTASNITPLNPVEFYPENTFAKDGNNLYLVGKGPIPSGIYMFRSIDGGVNWTAYNTNGLGSMVFPTAFIKTTGPFLIGGTSTQQNNYLLFKNISTVNIPETNLAGTWNLAPNPAQGMITLNAPGGNEIKMIEIMNIQGQSVLVAEYPGELVTVSELPAGIYFVRIEDASNAIAMKRLIIQHE